MGHYSSLKKNFDLLLEAFRGTREARADHNRSLNSPITIEAGLAALRIRWPQLRSPNLSAPVFILSAGWRSGSTYLQRWVMTDPHTLIWGEPYGNAGLIPSLAGQVKAFTQDWPFDEFFSDRQSHCGDLSQTWIANLYPALTDFMNAHIGYFEKLFLEPALASGKDRWGLKEVRLGVDHARYLQWLFPNAKFLFLYRNPYHAFSSYRRWRNWYKAWPTEPVFTAAQFGALWKELATDFIENHRKLGGLLLRYEELSTQATKSRLEDYLGFPLGETSSLKHVRGVGANDLPPRHAHWIPKLEKLLLKRQIGPLSMELGYQSR